LSCNGAVVATPDAASPIFVFDLTMGCWRLLKRLAA